MKRSIERILTTHTGSLPRPDNLMQMMIAKEQGKLAGASAVAPSIAWAKLQSLAEGARLASQELW